MEHLIRADYTTYTGDTLERYLRVKLIESMEYRAIGSWWDPKGYTDSKGNHQQCEIDIIAVRTDDKNAESPFLHPQFQAGEHGVGAE